MVEEGYAAPNTVKAAVLLLGEAGGQAHVLAGGTDIMVQLHAGLIDPQFIVDIKNIPELNAITEEAGGFRVGAAVSGMALMNHDAFAAAWPGVIDGVSLIGSIQVKGRASIGGNLCNASPAADSVPPLIAAEAVAAIAGTGGSREAPVKDIITGPGQTSLAPDEFITSFLFPPRAPHSGDAYLRLTPRTEMDIAVVGAGVNLMLDDAGECLAARIVLGAVAPTSILVPDAAEALVGTSVDAAALIALGEAASAACNPIDDKRGTRNYRIKTAAVIARRATEKALLRARAKQ